MEKVIWVIGNNREEMIFAQRAINAEGSMRAVCLLSFPAVCKAVENVQNVQSRIITPSLIVLDYEMSKQEENKTLIYIKQQQALAGVPLFFMAEARTREIDEECYSLGATVVVHKPFSSSGILRMERMAWQHEVTKNYEKMIQKQANDLQTAREIMRLNKQLEARNKLLYQIFGRYFSEDVLEVILENPKGAAIGGEKRYVTVLMSDLLGFTALSEDLESDAVTDMLNFYFGKMAEVINAHHGTIIEFLGDAVLAVFGAPVATEHQTEDAIGAAIEMQNAMEDVNSYGNERGYPLLEMGIGVHQGFLYVGNVGSEHMMRYNVIGRIVNECSRIESYCVGGQILVSEKTVVASQCPVVVNNRIEIHAKGVHNTFPVYEVVGIEGMDLFIKEHDLADRMTRVEEGISLLLYQIEGKKVQKVPIPGRLERFSRKRGVVVVGEANTDLSLYCDVEITAKNAEGRELFSGIYAKVVDFERGRVVLHFTLVNQGFECFAAKQRDDME